MYISWRDKIFNIDKNQNQNAIFQRRNTHTHTPEQAGNEEQTKCVFKPKPIKMIERFHERARFVCVRVFEWLC